MFVGSIGGCKDKITAPVDEPVIPRVVRTSPENGQSDVSLSKRAVIAHSVSPASVRVITATFSIPMDPKSIDTATFTVRQGSNVLEGSVSYSVSDTMAYFVVPDGLGPQLTYQCAITRGARSAAGVALANTYTWTFSTLATGTPTLVAPLNGAVNVSASPTMRWNASPGAETYRLQVSADSTFATTAYDDSTITGTSSPISGLSSGMDYYWRVRAKIAGGSSPYSGAWHFTTLGAPAPPVMSEPGDAAVEVPTGPTLSWDASPGAATYHLQVSMSSAFTTMVFDDSTLTGTSQQITGLSVATTYYWRLRAKNAGGISAWSTKHFTTIVPGTPTLVAPLNGAVNVSASPTMRWNASPGADTYRLQVSADSTFATTAYDDSTITGTSGFISGLTPGVVYYWRVRAKIGDGSSPYSAVWRFTPIGQPSVPSLVAPADGQVNVSPNPTMTWSTSSGAETYRLQISKDSSFSSTVYDDSANAGTSQPIHGLEVATTYYWRVNAKNVSGTSAYSGMWRFTTLTPPATPLLSLPVDASVETARNLTLSWVASPGADTYHLQVSTSGTFATRVYDDSTLTGITQPITGLTFGTTYHWRVRARNGGGTSSFSDTWTFTTIATLPQAPILAAPVDAAVGVSTQPTLSWNPSVGAQAYHLQVSLSTTFASMLYDDSTLVGTSVTVGGLPLGTLVVWRVRATKAGEWSAYSTIWRFTTIIDAPEPPMLLAPADSAVDVSTSPVLSWAESPGADTYHLEVSTSSTFATTVFGDSTLTGLSQQLTGLDVGTTYYWRLTAENAGGKSSYSETWSFTTVFVYTISTPSNPVTGGTTTGGGTYNSGSTATVTATPNSGYTFTNWTDGGVEVSTSATYEFLVTRNLTLEANFSINTFTLAASAGTDGSITPSGNVSVDYGSNQLFTITPNLGYHVLDVLIDGVSGGALTSYTFTNVTAGHTIAASFAIDTFTVAASAGPNGSISPSGNVSVNYGSNQPFTITPNLGYHVLDVLVDGVSGGALTSYTFTNVNEGHAIAASFAIDTFTVAASAGPNGSISPSGNVSVDYGSNQLFTITPNLGYHVLAVLIDGVSGGALTSYTFMNVTTGHTIAASFEIDSLTIVASAGANGSITPSGNVSVDYGSSQLFTITPNLGYHVLDVLVDGVSGGALTSHTFTNVTAGHTIAASFEIDSLTIVASAGPNGSISPSGNLSVDYGSNQLFTITPNLGYHVLDVLIDGVSGGALTSHTFTNVTAGHTIAASFEIDSLTIVASAGLNGSISPSGNVSVDYSSNQLFTITPDVGYHVLDVLIDGVSGGALTSHTFTNVTSGHSIAASFAINTFMVAASAGTNGTISPSGNVSVDYGSDQLFTITPNLGYHVLDVLIDGVSGGSLTSYTFTNVTAGHTIAASFAINTFTVAASAGTNGSISPSGNVSADYGSDQLFTITPDVGYHVLDVLIDGVSGGALTSHTFTNVTAGHTITASFAINTFTVTASAGSNGSITPSGNVSADYGSDQLFTITPDVGYHVLDVLIDGVSGGALTSHTFTNVTAGHTIAASFAINTFTVAASAGLNGSISPSGNVSVDYGSDQLFTITPDVGYHVLDVLIDGVSGGALTSYTFTNVTAGHTIAASFAINTFTVAASAGSNGSITPSGNVSVDYGSDQLFTVTPDVGYHVLDVLIDGVSGGALTSHTFTNVTAGHMIAASFAINTFTVAASAGSNGSISPSGNVSVDYGSDQLFTITPNLGYHVLDVLIDGVSGGALTSYTFTNVTAGHSIAASFEIDTFTVTASAGSNGSITPSGNVSVDYGSNQLFTITPDVGYHVLDVLIDGVSGGALTSHTFTNVTAGHTIAASFAINTFTVAASAGLNGSISPSGNVSVDYGSDQLFTITPSLGYHVQDVLIDGVSGGTLTSHTFTNVTAGHTIAASFAIDTFTVAASAGSNGSISPSGNVSVDYGSDQLFTITPNLGYHVLDVLIDGVSGGALTSHTFTNVTAGHTIAASFAINTFTVAASAGLNGSISPSGNVSVDYGSDQLFTVTPDVGYHVLDVLIDGVSGGALTSHTFTNVTAGHTIAASFAINTFTVAASAGSNGSITPSGNVSVDYGSDQLFTITPNLGYHVLDVLIDGVSGGALTSHTFTNVTAGHTIAASFAIDTFTVAASAGSNGSISPSGNVSVDYGSDQLFTITPNLGYHVLDVLVDGVSGGALASYTFTNVTAGHTIAASFEIDTFTVTASAGSNGSITPSGNVSVDYGSDQLFTITPNLGYHVLDVLIDGVSGGALTSHTFTNVTAGHTIAASFEIDTFTVTASAGSNGSITPSGNVSVDYGSDQLFTITPNLGYHVLDVLIDGVSGGALTSHTFTNVTAGHTIAASFEIDTFTVAASAGSNGSITPSGNVSVDYGSNQLFTITPDLGYHVLDVLVDGVSGGALASHTFTNVTAGHTIVASFEIDTFTVTASAGSNGSITPSGNVSVDYGSDQLFTITPNLGYHVLDVLIDGVSGGALTSHTFTNVTAGHTIAASFEIDTFTVTASAGSNGSITPSGNVSVDYGSDQLFTITPNLGYHVLDVLIDGVSGGALTSHTFTNVTAGHTIAASFEIDTFTVAASAGSNGSITPSGNVSVDYGSDQLFTITPNLGYHVLDVLIDGVSGGALTSHTFTNVTAGHTIAASFAIDTFTVAASAGSNGSISPSGNVSVDYGSDQLFTITPDAGYHVLDVLIDAVSGGAVTSHTFTNVTADHTIAATFLIDTPPTPTLVTPGDVAVDISTSPTLDWNTAAQAETYQLQVSTASDFSSTVFDDSTLTGTSQQITGLASVTTYYWHVNAKNAGGTSAYSTTWSFTTGQAPIELGTTSGFAILASSAITAATVSSITGDVGLSPTTGAAITGMLSAHVTGTIYAVDAAGPAGSVASPAMLVIAKDDAEAAYLDAMDVVRGTPTAIAGNLAAQTFTPGLYEQGSIDLSAAGTIILDAQGDTNAVFIIRSSATITTGAASVVSLVDGARARNVYWVAATSVTLGADADMHGTIIAQTISLGAGASLDGRALIRITGGTAVSLNNNIVVLPSP